MSSYLQRSNDDILKKAFFFHKNINFSTILPYYHFSTISPFYHFSTILPFLQLPSSFQLQHPWCRTPTRTPPWSATLTSLTTNVFGQLRMVQPTGNSKLFVLFSFCNSDFTRSDFYQVRLIIDHTFTRFGLN
jgi:hypothetical protein